MTIGDAPKLARLTLVKPALKAAALEHAARFSWRRAAAVLLEVYARVAEAA